VSPGLAGRRRVRVLSVAGLEPGGRAGLLADLEIIGAMGAQGLGVASALTAQGTRTFALEPVPSKLLAAQLRALGELGRVDAVKLGMIPGPGQLAVVRAAVTAWGGPPLVVDPVVRSSRGESLSRLRPRDYLALAGPTVVLTPNCAEAGWLLGWEGPVQTLAEAKEAASALAGRGFGAVVVKGGHLRGAKVDVVCESGSAPVLLEGARLPRRALEHRGTGCRHASAMAVALSRGQGVLRAARAGRRQVERYLGA
jgi:hydroxymethylpyrimidine/phosphomethylpyrimidine kinase